MNIRAVAARIIQRVLDQGASLNETIKDFSSEVAPQDQALLQAMCFGVCRWYFQLEEIVEHILDKPLKAKDSDVYALILVGLYQLFEVRIPTYAAVSETVAATKTLKKVWAKNLVNAVLRSYLRTKDENPVSIQNTYSHPQWMVDRIKSAWPAQWENILKANNQHPPLTLRVNVRQVSREKYLSKLTEKNLPALATNHTSEGITLSAPIDVVQLPGFAAGEISVQDGAAQLAAHLLRVAPGMHVLDACAAPGGKTAHLLELVDDLSLVAIDKDKKRLQRMNENLFRLQLSAQLIASNASRVSDWWDGQLFDRILLDAPCSASGVIRRHPDIKLLRRASDIPKLAAEQLELLTILWPLLKIDGFLLYATCSVFPEENTEIITQFLQAHPDAKEDVIGENWGFACEAGRQILPGEQGMDGFYYCRLKKVDPTQPGL